MSNAPQTTSYAPLPTDDAEESPSVQEKKTLLSSVFSGPVSLLRRHPLLSSIIVSVILACSVVDIVRRSWDVRDPFEHIQNHESGVALIGHIRRLHLTGRQLLVGWEVYGCGTYNVRGYPLAENPNDVDQIGCGVLNRAVDIYLNDAPKPTFSYDPAKSSLIPANLMPHLGLLRTFEMDQSIGFPFPKLYPFDDFLFTASGFVIETTTNNSVPILSFSVGDELDNFVISPSAWIRTKNNVTYDSGAGSTTAEVEYSWALLEAKRSLFSRAFTICLFLINWALTIASIYVTLLVVSRREKMDTAVLLLPITAVLFMMALRGLYAGAPPFGFYIDKFGFFLQMVVVAVCSVVLLYAIAPPRRTLE